MKIINLNYAQKYLQQLEAKIGKSGLEFCCSHGECKSSVHFRKEVEKVTGKRILTRPQTWVSNDVNDHKVGCPGPSEQDFDHLPHNGLSLSNAIVTRDETILFHLNIELGQRARRQFNTASLKNSADVQWRKDNPSSHSYFAVTDLQILSKNIAQIINQGGLDALMRTKIAHEGKIFPLQKFIVRNNAINRMEIIEGENGLSGLRRRGQLQANHSIKNPHGGNWVYGEPRLFMFEAAQTVQQGEHPNGKSAVRGHRYDTGDGRTVFDQLQLQKTDLKASDFYPQGALVLAIPFIHPDQKSEYPMVHWSIKSADQIDFDPPKDLFRILCKNGRNIPKMKVQPHKDPCQMRMDLRP